MDIQNMLKKLYNTPTQADGTAPASGTTATNRNGPPDFNSLSGLEMAKLGQAAVDIDCAHFLNRLRAAQAGSRLTTIGISATNGLALGIMGATSVAAPPIAIVGASLAAVNVIHNGFDEQVLLTRYADELAVLVKAKQTALIRSRDAATNTALTGNGAEARAAGLTWAAEYARTCNYSGLQLALYDAIKSGAQISTAGVSAVDDATLRDATFVGMARAIGTTVTEVGAAKILLASRGETKFDKDQPVKQWRERMASTSSDQRRNAQRAAEDAARLETASSVFRATVASQSGK